MLFELSAFFLTWLSAMADEYHKHERTRTLRKALHHWERTFRKAQNAMNFELADDAKAAYWDAWREYIKAEGSVNA